MFNNDQFKLMFALGATAIGAVAYSATANKRNDLKLAKIEAEYSPEYWEAKKAEAEASVAKHRLEVEAEERLKIDQRVRNDERAKAIREFEKDAPAEYWENKRIEQEEETRRFQMRQEAKNRYQLTDRRARALENSSRSLERTLKNFM